MSPYTRRTSLKFSFEIAYMHIPNLHHFLCNHREENENTLILLNAA